MSKATKNTAAESNTAADAGTQKVSAALTPVKKITVAVVCGTPKASTITELAKDMEIKEVKLCRIAGFANSVVGGNTQYGQWEGMQGQFAATNYATGEVFASKTAIVPGAMGEFLIDAVKEALKEDASSQVTFKVDIYAVVSKRDPEKYEYVVRPLIEQEIANPAIALLGL